MFVVVEGSPFSVPGTWFATARGVGGGSLDLRVALLFHHGFLSNSAELVIVPISFLLVFMDALLRARW